MKRRQQDLAAFVIPHHASDAGRIAHLEQTIESIFAQTDPHWVLVVADDCSAWPETLPRLEAIRARDPDRVHIVEGWFQAGPGAARNRAIRRAATLGATHVLYQDDDDLVHPRRVEVTRSIFRDRPEVGFVYSGFTAIDAEGREIAREAIRLDMLEVLEELDRGPLEGREVFARMAGETGFIATLATVAVPVETALAFPFPSGRASDDSHTWLRMAASGIEFAHTGETPTCYRIAGPSISDLGVNGRDRRFLHEKVHNDMDGFEQGVALALARRALIEADVPALAGNFLHRLASCVGRQGEQALADRLRSAPALSALSARLGTGPRNEATRHRAVVRFSDGQRVGP